MTEEDLGLDQPHYLYLSGTPFRAITNGEFTEDAIFNWTYIEEQRRRSAGTTRRAEPVHRPAGHGDLRYQIGEDAADWAEDGEFNGFSLNEYFKAERQAEGQRATGPVSTCSRTRPGSPSSSTCCAASCPTDEGADRRRPEAAVSL